MLGPLQTLKLNYLRPQACLVERKEFCFMARPFGFATKQEIRHNFRLKINLIYLYSIFSKIRGAHIGNSFFFDLCFINIYQFC